MSNIWDGLLETLATTEYPGRGLAIGRDANGDPFAAYWLTGRSVTSRSRHLMTSGDHSILVRDIGGSADDPLRHYAAYESRDGVLTVGNGTHVSDIARQITMPNHLASILTQYEYEPDAPIRTPRIAGVAEMRNDHLSVAVGSARSCSPAMTETEVVCTMTESVPLGWALSILTYNGSAESISTDGVPRWLRIGFGFEELPDLMWQALDHRFRVAISCVPLSRTMNLDKCVLLGLNN